VELREQVGSTEHVIDHKLSVIVCTRNRADQLDRCLRRFAEADAPTGGWELIIVDNDSSDHTKQVVQRASKSLPLQYYFAAKKGLSRARNLGLERAGGSIIAYTDDDCVVSRTWLTSLVREFADDPALQVLGGRVDLANERDLPMATRSFSDRLQISSYGQIVERLIGCNMAFRRGVFAAVGTFDPKLGIGTGSASAEDLDIFYRVLKAGFKICFSPDALIHHAHNRDTVEAARGMKDNYLKGRGAFYCKYTLRCDRFILGQALDEVGWLVKRIFARRPADGVHYDPSRALFYLAAGALHRLSGRE
jgi:glycosyltransferase involved in cell wall biosynthesis